MKQLLYRTNEIIHVDCLANALPLVMDAISDGVLCLKLGSPEVKSEIRL